MQTIICSLIVGLALLYVANRWLPTKLKLRLLGRKIPMQASGGGCSSCSSCGNCGSNSTKLVKK